ncbi:MAG: glycosidase [Gammaproteobacteria bacterium]|nr:glycosidase [Gammaproteobacteria bacterium]
MRAVKVATLTALLALQAACGGGGGGPTPPPDPGTTVTIQYLRADPSYDGWGLHLWGNAIAASVATTWSTPRMPDRIENGAAVFEIPVVDDTESLNFIAHNGDLKSPVFDLGIVPQDFGENVWIVQDEVASVSGNVGVPFASEAAALAALNALGNKSDTVDLSAVVVNDIDSGLPASWSGAASFLEIYVRGYQDSDGDGVGDLQGLIARLDYLSGLGVKGIWLMPVTESADNDHGYAVQDYRAIESDYGTMADFEQLLAEAHARGIAVIIDYVMNHAASTNPLFLDATTTAANDKRDWFIWEDQRPPGWNTFAGDPWRNNGNGWYYGVFSALMPDFNLRNPEVVDYHRDNLRFWLNKGVDGFRFDAVGVLFENGPGDWNNQPENHVLMNDALSVVTAYQKRFMVCEAPDNPSAFASATSCGRAFSFEAPGAIFSSVRNNRVDAGLISLLGTFRGDALPWFLSNHDSFAGDRVWNQLNGDVEQYKLAAATYLLTSRNPFMYYGEELGMANAAGLSGDHALRTPMSWTGDAVTGGFSAVIPFRELSANVASNNVADEEGDESSLLEYYRGLQQLRAAHPVIGSGDLVWESIAGEPVLRFRREGSTSMAVVAINYAATQQQVSVATSLAGLTFTAVLGASDQRIADGSGSLTVDVPPRSAVVYVGQP